MTSYRKKSHLVTVPQRKWIVFTKFCCLYREYRGKALMNCWEMDTKEMVTDGRTFVFVKCS